MCRPIIFVIVCQLATMHVARGRSYMTSVPVLEPSPPRYDIIDLVRQDIDYRFSDTHKRLTAIKDKLLKSCFVNDYDPQWNLRKHDKRRIAGRNSYDAVDTPDKFYQLRKKAGPVIANMCRREKIFWLTSDMLVPPPLMIGQSNIAPPTLAPNHDYAPPELSNDPAKHDAPKVNDGSATIETSYKTNMLLEPPLSDMTSPPRNPSQPMEPTLSNIRPPPHNVNRPIEPPSSNMGPPPRNPNQPIEPPLSNMGPPPRNPNQPIETPLADMRRPPPLSTGYVNSPPPLSVNEPPRMGSVPGSSNVQISPRLVYARPHTNQEPLRLVNNKPMRTPPPLPLWHQRGANEPHLGVNIPDNSSPPDKSSNRAVEPPPLDVQHNSNEGLNDEKKGTGEIIAPPLPDMSAPTQRKM